MEIPRSEAEARAHIASIRKDKRLDVPDSNTSDLENALDILSKQLYDKSTHFLLELIQNADDNTYINVTPTFNITLSDRMIRIDSNEVGFSRANTEAVCKIGRSTKTGLDKLTRYIGEKGIGFKSVFKIADVVWINSGHYSFKFDKNTRLGMIAPTWANPPEPPLPGYTSTYLQLEDDIDTSELLEELRSMDPRLLIFLRKLRNLDINIRDVNGGKWSSRLGRRDVVSVPSRGEIVSLQHNSNSMSYRITRHSISGLPEEPKRAGCSVSEILLAFPLNEANEPLISKQNVYAFLPIRDYGYKFLIQADFLLIASRGEIDSSSAWNKDLLEKIPSAFLRAVLEFNNGEHRYSWMRYLPSRPSMSDFFERLDSNIIRVLASKPILESLGGELTAPSRLRLVPASLSDGDGLPLIQSRATNLKYLSPKYMVEKDSEELLQLGVNWLTPEQFIVDLKQYTEDSPREFHNMPMTWHSCLCKALFRLISEKPALKAEIARLEIVPLKDGRWRSSIREKMCFSDSDDPMASIPTGIPIMEIDSEASSDDRRRSLFILLGAQLCSNEMVCKAIVSTHSSKTFRPNMLSLQDLISHVAFLYHAGWKNPNDDSIWLSTEGGGHKRSCEVYVDSKRAYSASEMFEDNREDVSFIHGDYYKDIFTIDENLKEWMVNVLGLAEFPRLVRDGAMKLTISDDFQVLLQTSDYISVLLLLKVRWDHYSEWFSHEDDPSIECAKVRLRDKISGMLVRCKRGEMARLKETMLLSSEEVGEAMSNLSIIDIPDPEDKKWKFLGCFGVVVNAGTGPFIQGLQLLKESGATVDQAALLYKQIYLHSSGQEEDLRKRFSDENLLFAPVSRTRSPKDWININDCVWDGPACLQKIACIHDFYPDHGRFFSLVLGVGKANWLTLMNEVQSIQAFDDIDYISDLFVAISLYLQDPRGATSVDVKKEMIASLIESSVFPIRAGKSDATFDYLSPAQPTDVWFIADREHLATTFDGLVPLLALKTETVGKISSLIMALGWAQRLLSNHVQGVPETGGRIQLTFEYTKSICEKARYIARLLPPDLVNRAEIIRQLCNTKVYTAEKVSIQWTLKTPDGSLEVTGRADSGRVKITPVGKALQIYIRKEDSDVSRPPFELREELSSFCCIQDASHVSLLHWIISEPSLDEIETIFKRKGLQNDVPELEALAESLKRSQNPQFWNKGPGDGRTRGKRNFRGKPHRQTRGRKSNPGGTSTLDVVQSFMNQFNDAGSWSAIAAKPWQSVDVNNMLAHLCRLENVDPYSLLSRNECDGPWNMRMKAGGAFPDDVVAFLFNEDLSIHNKNRFLRPAQRFPASVEITRDKGIHVNVTPTPVVEVGEEVILVGEVYISKMLERELGSAYKPQLHWTSHFRNRSGLDPFTGNERECSTFTIEDDAGSAAFKQLLLRHGYHKANSWKTGTKGPTYHIEVSTTEEDILGAFTLEPFQVQKAWLCHQNMSKTVEDVFILIRISDIRGDPEVALFVDPWQMHADGKLLIASDARYLAMFEKKPSFISLQGSERSEVTTKKSQKRISKVFSRKKAPQPEIWATADSVYAYKKLKIREIRILELFPGTGDEPIEGTVSHVAIEKASNFCAISYVWGPALKPYHLRTPEGRIPLTTSLHSALKRIRSSDSSIFVWADAICINQQNDYEKALQIRLLPTIFQAAEQVSAWTGSEDDNSHKAMQTLMQIRAKAVTPDEWPEELPLVSGNWRDGVPLPNDLVWKDIAKLFERVWFQRVWIIQEVVLAADVRFVCGAWDIDWDDLFSAVEICLDWAESLEFSETRIREIMLALKPAYALGLTRKSFKEMKLSPPFKLISLLDSFAHAQSTKECDKLFALLGLSSDAGIHAFDPDYISSIESVVRRYAAEFVRRGSAMDILYRAGTSKSYDFSTWIPNWTASKPCRTISTWRGANGTFSASGENEAQAHILPSHPDKLHVAGTIIDRITEVGSMTTAEHDVISVLIYIHQLLEGIENYPTGESKDELRLKLPIGNTITPCTDDIGAFEIETEIDEEGEHFDWQNANFDVTSLQDMVEFLKQNRDARDLGWRYWSTAAAFLKRLSYGRFAVTRRGYVGFGPNEVLVGDVVCTFKGGAVPFVLRKSSRGSHKLIGECYIHGIMYGESMDFDNVEPAEFILD